MINSQIEYKNSPIKRWIKIWLILLSISFRLSAQTNDPDAYFDIYSTRDGLSQNDVTCIIQDSYGFMWFGTNSGVNRFDGYEFSVFQREVGNPNSLSSNLTSSIMEDSKGDIWIGTNDAGITLYDRSADGMTQIRNSNFSPRTLTNNHVTCIQETPNGAIWVGTVNGLNIITRLEDGKLQFEHIWANASAPAALKSDRIFTIFNDDFGDTWLGTSSGLYRYKPSKNDSTHKFIHYQLPLPSPRVTDIIRNDTALVVNTIDGIMLLPFQEVYKTNPSFHKLNSGACRKITIDKEGNIWGARAQGAQVLFSTEDGLKRKIFKSDISNPNSISNNYCLSIFCDKNGMIWIGTNGGGVNMYNPARKRFRHYFETFEEGSLPGSKIRSIQEDRFGNLWVGTEGGGLDFHKKKSASSYKKNFELVELEGKEKLVFALEEAENIDKDLIYVGTDYPDYLHVARYEQKTEQLVSHVFEGHQIKGIVMALHHDASNYLWAGTYGDGLHRIKLDRNGKYVSSTFMKYDPLNKASTANVIRSIAEDIYGNLWVGTDRGLHKLTKEEKYKQSPAFVKYQYDVNDTTSIGYDYILPIYIAKDETIWVGTIGGGLNRVIPGSHANDDHFQRFNVTNGLIDNNVKSIEEDELGNLWLGTNKGLVKFDPNNYEYSNFSVSDGIQDWEFSEVASTTLSNGEMLFGGVNGITHFKPNEINKDTSSAQLVLTELKVMDATINPQEEVNGRVLLDKDLNEVEKIRLKHKENSFSVQFAMTHFAAPEKNQYAFMLEGFDKKWIDVSSDIRIARYTNVPAGKYTLKIKASNGDLFWNQKPISLAIEIAPPIWATIYAKILYLIITILCLWFFRKYTIIENSKKNQLLIDHLEKEKIEELNQLKFRFFTNVSHEFRTPLTLILGTHGAVEKDYQVFYRR